MRCHPTIRNTSGPRTWYRLATLLACVVFGTSAPVLAQVPLPSAPIRGIVASTLTVAGNVVQTLSNPQQNLVSTFIQQVSYEVGSGPASLFLDVHGVGTAFDQLQAQVEVVGFETITAAGTPSTPGSSAGSHVLTDGSGPVALLTGIENMRVTVNIRITVTLTSRYTLSGDRTFLFQYTLL